VAVAATVGTKRAAAAAPSSLRASFPPCRSLSPALSRFLARSRSVRASIGGGGGDRIKIVELDVSRLDATRGAIRDTG